jgi:hypothetical protein
LGFLLVLVCELFGGFLVVGYLVTTLVVLLDEIVILFVTHFLDVEGHGDVVEGVDFLGLEVGADVRKESLFI